MSDQGRLDGLAEVAIALAGFAAIVVVLKGRGEGKWALTDADQFHGMIVHAVVAVLFCLLPRWIYTVISDQTLATVVACVLLGCWTIVHSIGVMVRIVAGLWQRLAMALGLLVGAAQFAAVMAEPLMPPVLLYESGVVWHIAQASLLFLMLVWVRSEAIEGD